MSKVYYNLPRKLALFLPGVAMLLSTAQTGIAKQASSLKTSALESHEGMTISAQPWTNPAQYKEKFHKSPYAAGIVGVQVTFRNDSDDSLKVNLERIRLNITLSEEDHQALNPLTSEDAADVILKPATKNLGRSRFPIPIGGPKVGHDKKWVEMEQELRDAGVKASIVAPHSSVQGLLYFDLRSQFDLLANARLYVPSIVALEKNHELLYFEIDLSQAGEH